LLNRHLRGVICLRLNERVVLAVGLVFDSCLRWSAGLLVCWSAGLLVYWSIGLFINESDDWCLCMLNWRNRTP
jgi:hypothetical protein